MNLGSLLRKFYLYVDDEVQDYWTRDRAVEAINDGVLEAYRALEDTDEDYFIKCAEFTITADANGERVITLPEDFKRVQILERKPGSGSNVNPIPVEWVNFSSRHDLERYPTLRSAGFQRPRCWLSGNRIGVINPSEGFTLTLWYSHVIPKLDTDDDIPESIPADYETLIALHASKIAMGVERRVFAHQDLYNRELAKLEVASKQRQRHQPRYVHMVDG